MKRKTFLAILSGAATVPFTASCKRESSAPPASSKPGAAEQLAERIGTDANAAYFMGAAYIGDRLGLFQAMAGAGPLSARQLAAKTRLNERYVLEWLRAVASAHYIDYHAQSATFEMPSAHIPVLVDEDSPLFLGGWIEGIIPDMIMIPRVLAAFRNGAGIPYGDYPPEVFESIERSSKPEYQHLLTQKWLPAIPGAVERLRAGGSAADLGSGAGRASIAIAKAFPRARAFGFEPYAPSVTRARENAAAAGLAERVKFETFDGIHVPAGPYDLITINYSLHHAGDPVGLLRSSRRALTSGGAFFVLEFRKSSRLEEDIDSPRGGLYGVGLLECMPTALAEGGPGYGTGMTEPDIRDLAGKAGFREVSRVMADDPMRSFFVLRG